MRTILFLLLFIICIILMIGIYVQQPRLFGDTVSATNATVISATSTSTQNNPVIDLQSYKSTQTAIAAQSLPATPLPSAVLQTATVGIKQIPTAQATSIKPVRLPHTGNVDSSDIWSNTPILLLIGICIIISLGLWWQSRRTIK
jgi:hypothetical protein